MNVLKLCAIQRSAFITLKHVQRTAKLTDRWYFLIIWNTQSWWCILRVTGYCTITDEYVKWLRVPRTMNRLKLCAIERNALTIPKRVQRTAKWTFPIVCSTQSCWCILQVTGHLTVTVKYNQWFGVPRDMNLLKFCVISRSAFIISKRVQHTAKLTDRWHMLIICKT